MEKKDENYMIHLLEDIHSTVQQITSDSREVTDDNNEKGGGEKELVYVSFRGAEIFLFIKAFVDSGAAPNENYKSFINKLVPHISNKTQRGFSPESFCKFSDKVDPEAKENVLRLLQRMRRNIESYD